MSGLFGSMTYFFDNVNFKIVFAFITSECEFAVHPSSDYNLKVFLCMRAVLVFDFDLAYSVCTNSDHVTDALIILLYLVEQYMSIGAHYLLEGII